MKPLNIALQLYTVRDKLAKDWKNALAQVREIGYEAVEFAGRPFLEVEADKLRATLEEIGLQPISAHVPFPLLRERVDEVLGYARDVGLAYVVSEPDVRKVSSLAEVREVVEAMSEVGREAAQRGLRFCMHNHAVQFERKVDGKPVYQLLVEESDPKYVAFQPDVYWIKFAGYDPVEVISSLKGRCPLVHLKDMKDEESREMIEVGMGVIDFRLVIAASLKAGTEWFIIEHDRPSGDSMESAATMLRFLTEKFAIEP